MEMTKNMPGNMPNNVKEKMFGFTSQERRSIDLTQQIQGWGADLDPKNRPGVPKDKDPYIGVETLYPPIEPQISDVTILKSVEHSQMPAVFGTPCPPSGLSGLMRKFAFTYSEGTFTHWLTLLFADRVNVVEDLFKDLSRGHIPNLYKEMGLATEWKYNRKGVLKRAAMIGVGVAALGAAIVLLRNNEESATKKTLR